MLDKFLSPLTVLRLEKLWPHARKQGREIGQIYRVGYYCKGCGKETIWLVDEDGNYGWSADLDFIKRHFEIIELSRERSVYGKGRPEIGPLNGRDLAKPRHNETLTEAKRRRALSEKLRRCG